MPGTYDRDVLEPDLTVGLTLDAAETETGTAVDLDTVPTDCRLFVDVGTVTGTDSPTLTVTLQQAEDSAFTTNVRDVATVTTDDTDDQEYSVPAYVMEQHVRVVATVTGTTPDFSGAVITLRGHRYHLDTNTIG